MQGKVDPCFFLPKQQKDFVTCFLNAIFTTRLCACEKALIAVDGGTHNPEIIVLREKDNKILCQV